MTATTVTASSRRGQRTDFNTSQEIRDGDLGAAVATVLRRIPKHPLGLQPLISAVIGSDGSRVKHLRGLPELPGKGALELVVRESAERFFLSEAPFVTTTLIRVSPTEAIGGIIDMRVVDALRAACEDANVTLTTVHPADDLRLTYTPPRQSSPSSVVSTTRGALASAACLCAVIAVLIAPVVSARAITQKATRELATFSAANQRLTDTEHELAHTRTMLDTVAHFEQHRRSVTLLLAALTNALPAESAITTLRADSNTVDLVILSTRAAAVLGALDRVPGVAAAQMIGPVSRESANGRELERATIRFTYDPSSFAATTTTRTPYVSNVERSE